MLLKFKATYEIGVGLHDEISLLIEINASFTISSEKMQFI